MSKYVIDMGMLEFALILQSFPNQDGVDSVMEACGSVSTVERLRQMRGAQIVLPSDWRADLLMKDGLMRPIPDILNLGFDTCFTMDDQVNLFMSVENCLTSHFRIKTVPYTRKSAAKLHELHFLLPCKFYDLKTLITYKYAALAWQLGLPFLTRNTAFALAARPEVYEEDYCVLFANERTAIPERRMWIPANLPQPQSQANQDIFSWVELVADTCYVDEDDEDFEDDELDEDAFPVDEDDDEFFLSDDEGIDIKS